MKHQKIADNILKEYPGENKVIITEDGQAFFNDLSANNHHQRSGFEEVPEVFFREGHQPEDTKEMEEAFATTKEDKEKLVEVIAKIYDTTDLSKEKPVVNQETPDVLARVVSLRDLIEAKTDENEAIIKEVSDACNLDVDIPVVDENSTESLKAVVNLRTAFNQLQSDFDTLKATNVKVEATDVTATEKSADTTAAKKDGADKSNPKK